MNAFLTGLEASQGLSPSSVLLAVHAGFASIIMFLSNMHQLLPQQTPQPWTHKGRKEYFFEESFQYEEHLHPSCSGVCSTPLSNLLSTERATVSYWGSNSKSYNYLGKLLHSSEEENGELFWFLSQISKLEVSHYSSLVYRFQFLSLQSLLELVTNHILLNPKNSFWWL